MESETKEPQKQPAENYVDNDRLHLILCEAIPYFREHQNWGKHQKELGLIVLDMMERIRNKSNFKNYQGYYLEVMNQKALVNVFSYLHKYNPETSSPFPYLSTIIINAYRTALRESKKKVQEVSYDSDILSEIVDSECSAQIENDICQAMDEGLTKRIKYAKINDKDYMKTVENVMPKDIDEE